MSDFIIACPSSVFASLWFILVAELLEEATLSGRLCEREDDGTAWKSVAAEGWYDGTWNDWRWKTPDCRSSSSSSILRARWTWHDWGRPQPSSKQGWLPWNSPADTSKDPRQYGGERSEVIPSLDEVVAWLEASMLDPSEGEIEEPSHVGSWRQPKEAVEPQAAVEEDRIYERKPQRDVMPTAIPRAGALQG